MHAHFEPFNDYHYNGHEDPLTEAIRNIELRCHHEEDNQSMQRTYHYVSSKKKKSRRVTPIKQQQVLTRKTINYHLDKMSEKGYESDCSKPALDLKTTEKPEEAKPAKKKEHDGLHIDQIPHPDKVFDLEAITPETHQFFAPQYQQPYNSRQGQGHFNQRMQYGQWF